MKEFLIESRRELGVIKIKIKMKVKMKMKEKWDNKEYVLFRVSKSGSSFMYASERLQGDKEVLLAAMSKEVNVLRWASEELRADKEVILKALEKKGSSALFFADDKLKNDEEVVLKALESYLLSVMHVGEELHNRYDQYLREKNLLNGKEVGVNKWLSGSNASVQDFKDYLKLVIEEKRAKSEQKLLEDELKGSIVIEGEADGAGGSLDGGGVGCIEVGKKEKMKTVNEGQRAKGKSGNLGSSRRMRNRL